jgi:hypothetical protein
MGFPDPSHQFPFWQKGRGMHIVERGIDEALVVGDVIVRVVEILDQNEVRVAISSPNGKPRYQEIILRRAASDSQLSLDGTATAVSC